MTSEEPNLLCGQKRLLPPPASYSKPPSKRKFQPDQDLQEISQTEYEHKKVPKEGNQKKAIDYLEELIRDEFRVDYLKGKYTSVRE